MDVDEPDFRAPLVEAMHKATLMSPFFICSKLIRLLIMKCPPKIAVAMNPDVIGLLRMQEVSEHSPRVQNVELMVCPVTQTPNH